MCTLWKPFERYIQQQLHQENKEASVRFNVVIKQTPFWLQ